MPVMKVKGGYKCGPTGKVYRSRKKAAAQCRAIKSSQSAKKRRKHGY